MRRFVCILAIALMLIFSDFAGSNDFTGSDCLSTIEVVDEVETEDIWFWEGKNIDGEQIEKRIAKLLELGMDSDILANVKFKIHPGPYIRSYWEGENKYHVNGTWSNSTITIVEKEDIEIVYHELGHAIHNKKLNVDGYDWSNPNDLALQYIKMKNYNKELDYDTQIKLIWEDRIAEWFAEDVKQFLAERMRDDYCYRGIGPKKTEDIDKFLEQLIFE